MGHDPGARIQALTLYLTTATLKEIEEQMGLKA